MKIKKEVAPAFSDFIFDWDYETYFLVGGYGSGKSYHIALKILLKLLEEKRTCLVVREVFDTLFESCFSLFREILDGAGLAVDDKWEFKRKKNAVLLSKSPMSVIFKNGSRIIFKGMDKPEKVKSINDVSIVWIEEASEVKYAGYEELLGRIRTPNVSMHFILSTNPVSKENWVYRHFFSYLDEYGEEHKIVDDKELYERGVLVHGDTYYHHSIPTDNPWLPKKYIRRLDDMKNYDRALYLVARWGMFGPSGTRVLPQLYVADNRSSQKWHDRVEELGPQAQYFGFDFGFEESYNAVLSMTVDIHNGILIIWDEIYRNHITDPDFATCDEMQDLKDRLKSYYSQGYTKFLVADNEDPKAIRYYKQNGFRIRPCRNKFKGSRLSNTRKVKRFRRIVVMPNCKNTIRELKDLTYKRASNGDTVYDEFNIDPHSLSAIWYALDTVTVADAKDKKFYSRKGN